jgi:SET and MYND domain-containing protein
MWSKHGINDSLEVRESEHYGRGVYARAAISPGVEVMRAEPFVHVISDDVRGQLCDHCLKESETLLRCGHCKFVRYCSKDCQRGDWRCHGGECKGIARAVPHSPTPLMRMVARALQRTREMQATHKQEMDLFCSNVEKLSQEVKEELATLMFGVRLLLEEPDSHTMEKAYSILCKALCNTFTIHRADLDAIGAGLYLGPSLLNHSCLPNCVAVFNGPTLMIRAIRPIPAGEQLLISYLDLLDGLEQRRRTLRRTYSFQCECERCQTECAPVRPQH